MRLSTRLIVWEAVKREIIGAPKIGGFEKVAHFENDIAS